MKKEKDSVKRQLEHELKQITFTKHQEVLKRTHPVSLKQKLRAFWNKEVEIPLIPIGAVLTLVFFTWGISEFNHEHEPLTVKRELVQVGGNTYWKDELEKVVVLYED